ncbi:hypothetical protein INT45_013078 [Circinella minor]|uniref:Uncharacterized protein n=1 Tax=Circinella minor TaxID=1195481 RepID=A0A8H7RXR2_9FUNG|nr:hypothetical protein INT45_013078 [Circinella minor]
MEDFDLLHEYYQLQIKNYQSKEHVIKHFKEAGIDNIAGLAITADNIEESLIAEELDGAHFFDSLVNFGYFQIVARFQNHGFSAVTKQPSYCMARIMQHGKKKQ